MTLTFLGTGTSTGVPQVGCQCSVCRSADSRDKRLRTSLLLEAEGSRILFDCGPDFRQQMLGFPFAPLDAVFLTHEHYDHTGGIDDLRPFGAFGDVHVYAAPDCAAHLEERLPYCFAEHKYPGVPRICLHRLRPHVPVSVGKLRVVPFRVMHGRLPILAFRVGSLAYITDMKTFPEEEAPYLEGIDLLVVNALRHTSHNTHQSIEDAVAFARRTGARRTYLIHMGHNAGLHSESPRFLPPGISFAYDGLTVHHPL